MVRPLFTSDPGASVEESLCCWPDCFADIRGNAIKLPLCWRHALKAHRAAALTLDSYRDMVREHIHKRPIEPRPERQGYVYFIQFQNQIKIGFSVQPKVRIASLPHDRVLAVIEGTMRDEKRCHAAFDHLRTVGEWFRAEPDLIQFAESLNEDDE